MDPTTEVQNADLDTIATAHQELRLALSSTESLTLVDALDLPKEALIRRLMTIIKDVRAARLKIDGALNHIYRA